MEGNAAGGAYLTRKNSRAFFNFLFQKKGKKKNFPNEPYADMKTSPLGS